MAEDTGDSTYQRMLGRFQHASSEAGQVASYIRPEILAIPAAKMKKFLAAPELAPHRLTLERLLRYKPHTLGPGEEKLLAMQSRNGGDGEPRLPPVERRRSEIRHDQERERRSSSS